MVELSQAVVQLPYFLDDGLQEQALNDPRRLTPEVIGERHLVHTAALRLVATERLHERRRTWDAQVKGLPKGHEARGRAARSVWMREWQADWQFTDERRQRVMDRHPLAVRVAGRQLMQLTNRERLDDDGLPLDPDSVETIHGRSFLPASIENARRTIMHLRRAGFTRSLDTQHFQPQMLETVTYPAYALKYLEIFPVLALNADDEHAFNDVVKLLNITPNHMNEIIEQENIFPVMRADRSPGRHDREFYTPEAIARIREIVERTPYKTDDEVLLSRVIETAGRRDLVAVALENLGLSTPFRRIHGGPSRRCVTTNDRDRINNHIEYLTTRQPGEMDVRELADALGVHRTQVYPMLRPDEWARGRELYAKASENEPGSRRWRKRMLLPPDVVANVIERNRWQHLPPDLITEVGIATYLSHLPSAPQKYLRVLKEGGDSAIALRLTGSRRVLNCRPWKLLREMEQHFGLPADADRILWDRMPRGPFETDPERIEYAREWQRRLLKEPDDIDPTPIDEWIAHIKSQLEDFAAIAPPEGTQLLRIIPLRARHGGARLTPPPFYTPRSRRKGAHKAATARPPKPIAVPPTEVIIEEAPTIPSEPTPEPQRLASPAFPVGERPYGAYGPSRAPLPPEVARRYQPPRHTLVVPLREISARNRSSLFSAADIAEATGASIGQVETLIKGHLNLAEASLGAHKGVGQPAREIRNGQRVNCYTSAQIEPVLVELVGLTAEQIARRLNVDVSELAPYLGTGTWARANEHGRYNYSTWQQLRQEFQAAPPENWPLTQVISGMRESELLELAQSLGVPLRTYYVPGMGRVPHVGNTGAKLLMAQFPRYYEDGLIDYPWAPHDYYNRYALAAESGLDPHEVDEWARQHIHSSRDMRWMRVHDENLRRQDINVLPHYNNSMRERLLAYARTRSKSKHS
jgi:hypothetical protein